MKRKKYVLHELICLISKSFEWWGLCKCHSRTYNIIALLNFLIHPIHNSHSLHNKSYNSKLQLLKNFITEEKWAHSGPTNFGATHVKNPRARVAKEKPCFIFYYARLVFSSFSHYYFFVIMSISMFCIIFLLLLLLIFLLPCS